MIYLIIGVSGSGKTTIGKALSQELGYAFYDADDFHPPKNIAKMSQGIPLDDSDRLPWLLAIKLVIDEHQKEQKNAVITCSALKQSYRDLLEKNTTNIIWIYLKGSYETFLKRLQQRPDHFMKENMLISQFEALEEPENAVTIDVNLSVAEIVQEIINQTYTKIDSNAKS
ncbi:gluconokinase [Crocosphaera chwakensis]|uniref:Gluconokinase n=1 Tax=Crocosphaera chwakensis CCY0110 TaxID=391612 RepID=A3IKC8_9CHRO|nr:gluconokinase [Crocosphaera chwakensis]EAZ93117.1 Carbohydrate kinase, thermoresistant glucokinase [Crocosphaera chwakensis CCY0110]